MKIILEGTTEEIFDIVKPQKQICSSDTPHILEEIQSAPCSCIEKLCEKADDTIRSESLTKTSNEYIFDYHRRSGAEIPAYVKEMLYVSKDDLKKSLEQLQRLDRTNSRIRNMKLSELVYITNQANVRNHHV